MDAIFNKGDKMNELVKFQILQLKRALESNNFYDSHYIVFSDYPSESSIMRLLKDADSDYDLDLKRRMITELRNIIK